MGQHDLGNWEVGKWLEVQISQFPNFPKDLSPSGSARFGKLGNGYRYILPNFPKRHQPRWASTIWEIGKLENGLRYRFPNFPISQKISAHLAQHDLGNWEMVTGTYFPISQFPKRPQPRWDSTIWEIGKLGNGWRYRFPNFPISQKISAHLAQHDLGNWEMVTGTYFPISQVPKDTSPDGPARFGKLGNLEMAGGTDFPISQFPKRSQPIWLSTIWEIGKWLQVHTSQFPQKTPAQMGQHDSGNWEIGKPKP